ncbi:unnamed protein product [Moneuplotes crassus]|uniref:EF-hand domain-containing protein n=1 Tax=Euplotes crassus TaxID=5936 RepID=A0AAD1Y517_EUPCR|nr:unnamed protein product [Moneuplotes crassus]
MSLGPCFTPKLAFNLFSEYLEDGNTKIMSVQKLKCALLYLFGKKPSDEDLLTILSSIAPRIKPLESLEELDALTEHEFTLVYLKLIDQYATRVTFQVPSEYEVYSEVFEIFEDFEHQNEDKKGFISKQDFKAAVAQYMPESQYEDLDQIFGYIDSNKDGEVSFKDFVDLLKFKI